MAAPRHQCLITGATGQLGRELIQQLGDQAIPKTREALDINNAERVSSAITSARPDVVIHTAAYTDWMTAENNRDRCWKTNAVAVDLMVKACAAAGVPLIHISCDSVFGMNGGGQPHSEEDPVGPVNFHGQSKVAGEHAFLGAAQAVGAAQWKAGFRYWLIRTSSLYARPTGPGRNLAYDILSCKNRGRVGLAENVFRSPTYVPHLAKALIWLVKNRADVPCGLYHIANGGSASLYDFGMALTLATRCHVDIEDVPAEQMAKNRGYDDRLCPRNTSLSCEKFDQVCTLSMPCWRDAIKDFAKHWGRH